MPDVYSVITEADDAVIERVALAMETSAADPQHEAMVADYLSRLDLTDRSRVVEIGCGTGAIARIITRLTEVGEYVGTDPSEPLLERARRLAPGGRLRFERADGADLPFDDASFDAAIIHRVLSHAPDPTAVVTEAVRVLSPGGVLAICDGDYATTTVALSAADPLQCCVAAFTPAFVNDAWVVRRLSRLATEAGVERLQVRSYGFVQVHDAEYMLSIIERGAAQLVTSGTIGPQLAAALTGEAQRRVDNGTFFGHVAYGSLTATKPRMQPGSEAREPQRARRESNPQPCDP